MPYSQRIRTERQIAIGRAALAVFSLAAVWLDPAERGHFDAALYSLTAAYAVYAVGLSLFVPRAVGYLGRLQVVSHAIDIVAFSAFIYFTDGPTSLFFVFFVFVVITATLRWQWRGVFWTTLSTVVAFLGVAVASALAGDEDTFEFNHIIIGVVYLGVVAWLLAFLGLHAARLRQGVGRLAAWSQDTARGEIDEDGLSRMLAHAAKTMDAPRVVFAWEDEEEPWLEIVFWEGGHASRSRAAPDDFSPLVPAGLRKIPFLCPDARGGQKVFAVYGEDRDLRQYHGAPLNQAFAERFNIGPVISVPVDIVGARGRLFFLDKPNMSSDDLILAGVVGSAVGLLTEESRLQARLRESAAYEERVRLAADLHDGVLQSLTGTALQLETARRLLERDVPAGQELIENVQRSLAAEQRDLRLFVDELKPRGTMEGTAIVGLPARLRELSASISRQWGLDVEMVLEGLGAPDISADGLATDVYLIVREGLVNSARHARATRARATVRSAIDSLEVEVEDNGTGFPFEGRHDAASLRAMGTGPVALMQRVAARGGTLAVDSSATGSRVEITLPLALPLAAPLIEGIRDIP